MCASLQTQITNTKQEISHSIPGHTSTWGIAAANTKGETLRMRLAEKKTKKLSEFEKKKRKNRCICPKAPPSDQETPAPRTVVNLSGVDVSPPELSLLSKGLKFAPKPPRANRFQLKQDLEDFGRRIRLREFFYDPEASDDEDEGNHQEDRKFREKSTWTPPKNRDAAIETYLKAVETDA